MSAFVANFGAWLTAARRLGLARSAVKAARKSRLLDVPALRRWDVLHDESIHRPERMRLFLERYEGVAAARTGWRPLTFEGKRVLEIGCGPLGGWGPLAVFRGAAHYAACDPVLDPVILRSRRFAEIYLKPAYEDLMAHDPMTRYGDLETFLAAWENRSVYSCGGPESLPLDARYDIVLSNSCLEHIVPFAPSIAALTARLAPGARMLHLVDFSNHRHKASPFRPLYDLEPEAYHRRYGPHINLLRPPEMVEAFAQNGFAVQCLPVDERPDLLQPEAIEPAWTRRFDLPTLAIRTAVLLGAAPDGSEGAT